MTDLLIVMVVGWLAGNGLCLLIGIAVCWWDGRIHRPEDDL